MPQSQKSQETSRPTKCSFPTRSSHQQPKHHWLEKLPVNQSNSNEPEHPTDTSWDALMPRCYSLPSKGDTHNSRLPTRMILEAWKKDWPHSKETMSRAPAKRSVPQSSPGPLESASKPNAHALPTWTLAFHPCSTMACRVTEAQHPTPISSSGRIGLGLPKAL